MLPRTNSRPTHRWGATALVGALALLALAACADDTTAPKPTNAPEKPNAIKLSTTWVTARFVDDAGNPAYPLWLSITSSGGATRGIGDNGPSDDSDPREGYVKVQMVTAPLYTACLTGVNAYFVWDTSCKYAQPVNGTADLGTFIVHRRPEIHFYMKDRNENLLGGAELAVTGLDGVTYLYADGVTGDQPNDGIIRVRVDGLATFTWCETKPPTGYLLAKPNCGTVTTTAWGQQLGKGIYHTLALMPPTNPF